MDAAQGPVMALKTQCNYESNILNWYRRVHEVILKRPYEDAGPNLSWRRLTRWRRWYLICPLTSGRFFVRFMLESKGTSKYCEERRMVSEHKLVVCPCKPQIQVCSYRLPTLWLQVLSIYANSHFMKLCIFLQHTHDTCHVNVHRNVHQFGESTSHAFTTAASQVFFHETSVEEPCEGSRVRQTPAPKRSPCTFQSKWEQMDWRWRLRAGWWVVLVLRVGEGSGTQLCEKLLILLFYDVLWRSMLQSAPRRLAMCD